MTPKPSPSLPWRALSTLLGDLARMPLSDSEENFSYLLEGLAELVHGSSAFTIFARCHKPQLERDPMKGWRLAHMTYLNPEPLDFAVRKRLEDTIELSEEQIHQGLIAHVPYIGSTRIMLWQDIIPDQTFVESDLYEEFYAPLDVRDRMFMVVTVDAQLEAYICIDRPSSMSPFDRSDCTALAQTVRAIEPVITRYCQHYGLLGEQTPLSPRERETLSLLLKGLSEKEVAARLGVTPRSAHQYVVSIYRKLGVHSRARLMAMWFDPLCA